MQATRSASGLGGKLLWLGVCVVLSPSIGGDPAWAESRTSKPDPLAMGYEIFNREWMPNDPRAHGGDGLGPVYNDTSCVACHNSGGSGGGGPVSKNIDILHASRNSGVPGNFIISGDVSPVTIDDSNGFNPAQKPQEKPAASSPSAQLDPLVAIHAGFRNSRTVVLHKFGTDPNYDAWRSKALGEPLGPQMGTFILSNTSPIPSNTSLNGEVTTLRAEAISVPAPTVSASPVAAGEAVVVAEPPGVAAPTSSPFDSVAITTARRGGGGADDARASERIAQVQQAMMMDNRAGFQLPMAAGPFQATRSQRNPTSLFGLGLIDAIPEATIEALAKRQAKETPAIQGRASRLKDGRIGRLGWKGQTANVEDFVLNACAVEVGLEVPGHTQALQPQAPRYKPPGLDLTSEECNALVAYVRSLPRPVERTASGAVEANFLGAGKATFARIGCAGCHAPSVGNVEGIYSDLLLHDMGPEMEDSGSYGDSGDDGSDEPLVPLLASEAGQPAQPQAQLQPTPAPRKLTVATRREWRTPPLWGFRDSGPYLHDGRAQTLEQAVVMHGGQGAASSQQFFRLSSRERLQVEAFLKSLVAPPSKLLARAGD